MKREIIIYKGVTFARYPESKSKSRARYFYPFSKTWPNGKKIKALHQEIWMEQNGEIPDGHMIHHKDEDFNNNDPLNLECVTRKQHDLKHIEKMKERISSPEHIEHLGNIRNLTKKWHASREGIEWHSKHGKETWIGRGKVTKICEVCGQEFEASFDRARFCSRSCRQKDYRTTHTITKKCEICGKEFTNDWTCKSKERSTCSRECGAKLRTIRRMTDRICIKCGNTFRATQGKYCSRKCYNEDYFAKKRKEL